MPGGAAIVFTFIRIPLCHTVGGRASLRGVFCVHVCLNLDLAWMPFVILILVVIVVTTEPPSPPVFQRFVLTSVTGVPSISPQNLPFHARMVHYSDSGRGWFTCRLLQFVIYTSLGWYDKQNGRL